jgi:sedoheptulokinase
MKFIGIDIGTTSICAVVMNTQCGAIHAVTRANDCWIQSQNPWERIQDPAKIASTVRRVLDGLLDEHQQIAGIGVTGQMHGIVYVDKQGGAVSPLYTWQDTRGGLPVRGGTMSYAEQLAQATGYALAPGLGMVTHWYNLQNGLVPGEACGFCTIHDYLVMQVTGNTTPLMDPTDAASLGVFDIHANAFDQPALERAGIALRHLPQVVGSGTRAGCFREVPVYVALGDNQASYLGSVRDVESSLLVNIGTGGQVSAFTQELVAIDGLDVRPFPGRGYLLVGPLLCGGKAYAMLENFFRRTTDFFGLPAGAADLYSRMNAIDHVAVADHPGVDTRFAGTRQNPAMRGMIRDISMDNFTPQHLIAGFLEGVAAEVHQFYLMMPEAVRGAIVALVGAGNGLRRNELLCRILSGRFGHPMQIPVQREEAAIGAALTAAVGAGHFSDFQSAGRMIHYAAEDGAGGGGAQVPSTQPNQETGISS